jgi:putative RNA 2'-phosphotransferase
MGMTTKGAKKAGLFMCLVLRHKPSAANVTADAEGWVDLEGMIRGSMGILTRELVMDIVATNNKQRFAVSEDGKKIRAKQGHSIPVDLKLEPVKPPEFLYHGTEHAVTRVILAEGLKKMRRHHVHMAEETGTAVKVGMRHGSPVVFRIDAGKMHEFGHTFYRSENGVWLVEYVPPEYLKRVSTGDM